jgi:maltose alpha-D-glucosyltransferase/alpha-amylase
MLLQENPLEDDPLWYKDAIIYELHVKTFFDSNDDGIGDFKGLTEKLDYLKSLGITALWLLPFYPSPLRDDGYDIAHFQDIKAEYGTLRDFKVFVKEAHKRGLRVITELVVNHTSDQHPWFQKARYAKKESSRRDFYVWSDNPEKYQDARIIFKDFESSNWSWDPVAKSYFWHRFYSHQPDLNYDNPQVHKALFKVINYWMDMGVDGMRLDAVPYLYEREGTNCENLPETYAFLQKLRTHVEQNYTNKMLLAEANQWPEDAVAYFGNSDECHMAFHFPLMPRMFMALWMEDRFPIVDILEQTPPIPDDCQWALFLRNHDELTLEMVTDEERDYMNRVYAKDPMAKINFGIRRRLAPLLTNHRRKIEIMNLLLFTLPGTPVIYYGDEIGMGDNYYLGDRNGVRTPMQWNADRNAGFSKANPQKLYLPTIIDPDYHYELVNVENQERKQSSLLWWMRRVIGMRNRFKAFGRGTIEFLKPDNSKIFAFIREYQDEMILIVVNLSRFSQVVELDLSRFEGYIPEEIFGKNKFPMIKQSPYVLTLGHFGYYCFFLKKEEIAVSVSKEKKVRGLTVSGNWEQVFSGSVREKLETQILPEYLKTSRWYGGKARIIQELNIIENIPIKKNNTTTHLLILELTYTEGLPELYLLPLAFIAGHEIKDFAEHFPRAIVANIITKGEEGILYDGSFSEEFRKDLFSLIAQRKSIKGVKGTLIGSIGKKFAKLIKENTEVTSKILQAEQSNTSFIYGDVFFFKLFRRLDEGINPDFEIGRFLTEKTAFSQIAHFAGTIEYKKGGSDPTVIGILQTLVPNQGDAWTYSLDSLGRFYERVLVKRGDLEIAPEISSSLIELASQELPHLLHELIGGVYLEMVGLLGKRTGELHLELSSGKGDPNFSPEPFSILYQRSLYQSMASLTKKNFELLRKCSRYIRDNVQEEFLKILDSEEIILNRFKTLYSQKIATIKTRIHGDYHLGQVLFTGNDFVIIDFEGEPARALSERRLKRSPLRDVAGMVRSFHYAAYASLFQHLNHKPEDFQELEVYADLWYKYVGGRFLGSYLETVKGSSIIPEDKDHLEILLNSFLLEKAIYELGYEINNRPEWIIIPLKGTKQLLAYNNS